MRPNYLTGLVFSLALTGSTALQAEDSGFLPDYTGLEFSSGEYGGKTAPVPNVTDKMAGITKVMVDQPEIFIADESDYKGLKPDDARALAESLRAAIIAHFDPKNVVEEPGPDVLYLRMAITDLHLKKKKRRLLSYTPVGLVAHTAKSLAVSDVMKKINLEEVTVEMQSLNAASGENLGSLVLKFAPKKKADESDEATWENLLVNFDALGQQIVCRIGNSKVAEAQRKDCKILESYQEG